LPTPREPTDKVVTVTEPLRTMGTELPANTWEPKKELTDDEALATPPVNKCKREALTAADAGREPGRQLCEQEDP